MLISITTASFVSSVFLPEARIISLPLIFSSRSGTETAIRSITFSLIASVSVIERLFLTASSAHWILRSRFSLMVLIKLQNRWWLFLNYGIMFTLPLYRRAAPILVPGAMTAHDRKGYKINLPKQPESSGYTKTTTGISESRISVTMPWSILTNARGIKFYNKNSAFSSAARFNLKRLIMQLMDLLNASSKIEYMFYPYSIH
jgi:hypothetical protein